MMKISICIPQYNRIKFLLKGLSVIERQEFKNIEVLVSDDCSTDSTQEEILKLIPVYKFPLSYHRFDTNQGYDRNLRKCMEMATGDYCIILGNDDTINPEYDLKDLSSFLYNNGNPDIGFANYIEDGSSYVFKRAKQTVVIGSGAKTALQYYSCFSFVAGIIISRKRFLEFNTNKYDGSIYAQIYLATLMVSKGYRLFSIHDSLVIKDILVEGNKRNSYRDTLTRSWAHYKKVNGGLPSVINVLHAAFWDAGVYTKELEYKIFRKIYLTTLPFWVMDYKQNKAFPEAVGIIHGMFPSAINHFNNLSFWDRQKIFGMYMATSVSSILFPSFVFKQLRNRLYNLFKK